MSPLDEACPAPGSVRRRCRAKTLDEAFVGKRAKLDDDWYDDTSTVAPDSELEQAEAELTQQFSSNGATKHEEDHGVKMFTLGRTWGRYLRLWDCIWEI